MADIVIPVVTLVLGVVLTRLFDVYERRERYRREDSVSTREHQKWVDQQWWQRKADTYSTILDTLWHEYNYASETLDYYWSVVEGGSGQAPVARSNWKERQELLKSKAQFGGFYISGDAAEALREFFADLSKIDYEDVMNPPEVHLSASKKCMETIKEIAAADLGIRWERLSPTITDSPADERLSRERNDSR